MSKYSLDSGEKAELKQWMKKEFTEYLQGDRYQSVNTFGNRLGGMCTTFRLKVINGVAVATFKGGSYDHYAGYPDGPNHEEIAEKLAHELTYPTPWVPDPVKEEELRRKRIFSEMRSTQNKSCQPDGRGMLEGWE